MTGYKEIICSNCKYKDNCKGTIQTIQSDNLTTMKCEEYKKDKVFKGYRKPLERTAKLERTVMPYLITDWSRL